ncbi:Imm50 family immunity protein [Paenibacillus periandrae]|uniref:Imm50 family immunity protein n=1 Tax=Paenibacillus periandrae TaxID=1761741 RepID=UPI001F08CBAC|nr:Imm50 family immunity protein [Paenibacillus periandrae]
MSNEWVWDVTVRSVEREEICFAPNSDWQVQAQGFRLHFNTVLPNLRTQDQILVSVGEWDTPTWAAFIGTAVECSPESILLYTSPQYESRLWNARRIERTFSPLMSIKGAQNVIDRLGLFPPFHYDEITKVCMDAEERSNIPMNLSVTIRHTSTGGLEQHIDFYFADIQQENVTPAEECNICLQLSFKYEGECIRVQLDAVSGFAASFLCHKIAVQLQDT